MLELAIVTDEIDTNITNAVKLGHSWGIRKFELRCIGPNRIPAISEEDVSQLKQLKDEYGIVYTALSPGILKLPLSRERELDVEITDTLPRTIELAHTLGVGMIIVFGFQRETGETDSNRKRIPDIFGRIESYAADADIMITVENEPGFWFDTGRNSKDLLAEIGSPHIRANWDPANAIGTDEKPYPDGYEALKGFIGNVHAKDTDSHALERCVAIGEGLVDWKGQIRALVEDQIVPHITIETHVLPLIEKSLQNIKTISDYIRLAADKNK
jgi:sugar phosphate isomerase/epimerase